MSLDVGALSALLAAAGPAAADAVAELRKILAARPQPLEPPAELKSLLAAENTAAVAPDLRRFRAACETHLQDTERYINAVRAVVDALEVLGVQPYSENWWEQQRFALETAFQSDPASGLALWQRSFVSALEAWQLDALQQLVSAPYAGAAEAAGVLPLFQQGAEALASGRYQDARSLIDYLTDRALENTLPAGSRAALLVLRARIDLLLEPPDVAHAVQRLEQASALAPEDARVVAARGDAFRKAGETERAREQYQRAARMSPDLPDAALGLGQLLQDQQLWDEADDQYAHAIELVRRQTTEHDIVGALTRLLAPVSGNLYQQLARTLKRDDPEQALRAIARALELGVVHEGDAPERLAHRLRGEILDALGRSVDAANAYREASVGYLTRNEPNIAAELLRRARELDPDAPLTYWLLADSLRMNATRATPPYLDAELVTESRAVWEAGMSRRPPLEAEAWAYGAGAAINEQLARLPGSDPHTLFWESIVWLERALLLRSWDSYRWGELSQAYRTLRLWPNALRASERGLEADPKNVSVWEERIVLLSHLARWQETREALDKRYAITDQPAYWYDGVRGYVLYLEGAPLEDALVKLDSAVSGAPEGALWCQDVRAACLRRNAEFERAELDYDAIWQRYKPGIIDNRELFGIAAYQLGLLDEASTILSEMVRMPGEAAKAENFLGLCHLMRGDLARGAEFLARGIALTEPVELMELLDLELPDLERRAQLDPAAWLDAKQPVLAAAMLRQMTLRDLGTADAELARIRSAAEAAGNVGNSAWLGCTAGLARLHLEQGNWQEAAAFYRQLIAQADSIPEAGLGLDRAIRASETGARALMRDGKLEDAIAQLLAALAWTEPQISSETRRALHECLAEALLQTGDAQGAVAQFQESLVLAQAAADAVAQAQLQGRIAYSWLRAGDEREARDRFAGALQEFSGAGGGAGEKLAAACMDLITDPKRYWDLDGAWRLAASDHPSEGVKALFADARSSLRGFLEKHFRTTGQSSVFPVTNAISVDLAANLVPEDTGPESLLIGTYIPEMRARIEADTGVRVPSVRLGSSELYAGTYVISLDEVPLVVGNAQADKAFCVADSAQLVELGVPAEEIDETPEPVTLRAGCWLARPYWDSARAQQLPLWTDPLVYVIRHVEAVLRDNLADFVGVQDVENLLQSLSATDEGRDMIAAALPDAAARLRFARLLRALARERVPISDWRTILTTFQAAGPPTAELQELVQKVRGALRTSLPGNEPGARRLELPASLEDQIRPWVSTHAGKTFFALPPEDTQELLGEIRELVAEHEDNQLVLVVRDARVRHYVRRLVELEFPRLMVLAQDECLALDGQDMLTSKARQAEGAVSNA